MMPINSAHSVMRSIGGDMMNVMISGYYVDHTTMPKRKGVQNKYGASLTAFFELSQKRSNNLKK